MYHLPVLLHESIEGLNIQQEGIYVDATFGGGGHSREILKLLKNGKLVAIDKDMDALQNRIDDEKLILIRDDFRNIKKIMQGLNIKNIRGLLADLGVSSHQFDEPHRGFSFRDDAFLDMRMDSRQSLTAEKILNNYPYESLKKILRRYGEVTRPGAIAKRICTERMKKKIHTANQLKEILKGFSPEQRVNKFLAKIFQAVRIEVNDEMEALKKLLRQSAELIQNGGRLCIISYHSLEDRLVKNFIRHGNFEGESIRDFMGRSTVPFREVIKKPVRPAESEVRHNSRARSAKLRVAEKI